MMSAFRFRKAIRSFRFLADSSSQGPLACARSADGSPACCGNVVFGSTAHLQPRTASAKEPGTLQAPNRHRCRRESLGCHASTEPGDFVAVKHYMTSSVC